MKNIIFNQINKKIKEYHTIIIHRHSNPDGDAIGSQIGLKEAIKATFPNKEVYAVGDMNERYQFMAVMDEIPDEKYHNALVIVCDCGGSHLINDSRYKNSAFLIKIDHHLAVEDYGDINYVDESRESCAGIVTDFIMNNHYQLTKVGAEALYTGICTDSGRFRYNSTTEATFLACAYLAKYNIDLDRIYNDLYLEDIEKVKLRAKLTYEFKLTSANVAYLVNTQEDLKNYHIDVFGMSRGMVNIMAGIKGINIWANFTEDIDGKILVELRSNQLNINQVAVKWGGGGHLCASGCTISSFDQVQDVLDDLDKVALGGTL